MEKAPWRDVGVDGKITELIFVRQAMSGRTGFCKLKDMSCFHFRLYFRIFAAVTTRHRFQTILSCKPHSRDFAKRLFIQCVGNDLLEVIRKKTVGALLKELFQKLRGGSEENHRNSE
jgi:hypothetical protein